MLHIQSYCQKSFGFKKWTILRHCLIKEQLAIFQRNSCVVRARGIKKMLTKVRGPSHGSLRSSADPAMAPWEFVMTPDFSDLVRVQRTVWSMGAAKFPPNSRPLAYHEQDSVSFSNPPNCPHWKPWCDGGKLENSNYWIKGENHRSKCLKV